MGKLSGWLTTLAFGAGLMYMFDPDRGARRRALLRDRFTGLQHDFSDALDVGMRDLRNQAQGYMAEAQTLINKQKVDDRIIEERIRSRLGYLVPNASAIQVMVNDGAAQVSGDILTDDVDMLMKGVAKIHGVHSVENKLSVHKDAGNIPSLQGLDEARERMHQNQMGWMPGTRLVAGSAATLMILYGGLRRGLFGRAYNLGGWALLFRTLSNKPIKRSLGLNGGTPITINRSTKIEAPVEKVYEYWNNFTNFPKFMENIKEVRDQGDGHYRWVAKGPAGVPVEWDAIVTDNQPNKRIAWESVPTSEVQTRGSVDFQRVNDNATQVNVHMEYTPPAGVLGHAVAQLFGQDPKTAMVEDLNRLRSLLTTGKTTADGKKVTEQEANKPRTETNKP